MKKTLSSEEVEVDAVLPLAEEAGRDLTKAMPLVFALPHAASIKVGERPSADFVVSRFANGRVASRLGDDSWNWTPYVETGKSSNLNFVFWRGKAGEVEKALLGEMQWVMYLLLWRRERPVYRFDTVKGYVLALRFLAKHCLAAKCSLEEIFSDSTKLVAAALSIPAYSVQNLHTFVRELGELGASEVGFGVAGAEAEKKLRSIAREYENSRSQTAPIPTRIYAHILGTLANELAEFRSLADEYLAAVSHCLANDLAGRSRSRQKDKAALGGKADWEYQLDAPALLERYGLSEYFASKGLSVSVGGLVGGLSRIQLVFKLLIQSYTGMRDGEAGLLTCSSLEPMVFDGKVHFTFRGTTTKLKDEGARDARWVTSDVGRQAFELAKSIAVLCRKNACEGRKEVFAAEKDCPLFLSVSYLGIVGSAPIGSDEQLLVADLDLNRFPEFRRILELELAAVDLLELKHIDPFRAWGSEKDFSLGQPWTLKSHQLRRSLALYAQRSGLVSLPSLRRQLQHITDEMTRFYARGSAFSDDFIGGDEKHFGVEWRKSQPVSSALGYLALVLDGGQLFGGHGAWIEHRVRGEENSLVSDRAGTLRAFKTGQISYRETFLGGCTSSEPCRRLPVKWFNVKCINGCKDFVGSLVKLRRVIASQRRLVDKLAPDADEYRQEKADLDSLVAAERAAVSWAEMEGARV